MTDAARDYSDTLFLPKTDFPMRAGLPQKEPEILARWQKLNLYQRLRAAARGRAKFILHDGPPYANGNIHIGHALNKILKDVVTRSQQMLGSDSNYVPGWDCHGLPIEWKIEEEFYRSKNKQKPVMRPMLPRNLSVVIWTTTPWTLPGNRAISFNPKISYGIYFVKDVPAENWSKVGDYFLLADSLAPEVMKQARVVEYERKSGINAEDLAALECDHPL